MGILTVGIVTTPFLFEGKRRMDQAEGGIQRLRENVDSLIVIPNERLKHISEEKITLQNAFRAADDVLRQGVQSITDLIVIPGLVNLDFADVTSVMKDAGYALMGVGVASGKDKAKLAAQNAISSPLLGTSIQGAKGLIVNIKASPDIGLDEIQDASTMISEQADENAIIIWGAALDEEMEDTLCVIVIATGFPTTDNCLPPMMTPKKDDRRSPFQYGGSAPKQDMPRYNAPVRQPDRSSRGQQPMYQQPAYGHPAAPAEDNMQHNNAPVYPNAGTKGGMASPAAPSPKGGDSDDSYIDIMRIFNSK